MPTKVEIAGWELEGESARVLWARWLAVAVWIFFSRRRQTQRGTNVRALLHFFFSSIKKGRQDSTQ